VNALLVMYLVIGLLTVLISLPLIAGRVKPNPVYGFRIRATLENPETWYKVNKYFAQRLLLAGLVETLASIGLYFASGGSEDLYALSVLAVFVVTFSLALTQTLRYLKTL